MASDFLFKALQEVKERIDCVWYISKIFIRKAFYEEMSSAILLQDYMAWTSVQTASHQLCNTKFCIVCLSNKIGHFLSPLYIVGIQLPYSASLCFSIRRMGHILQWYLWERSIVRTILLFRLLLKTFCPTSCSLWHLRKNPQFNDIQKKIKGKINDISTTWHERKYLQTTPEHLCVSKP